MHGDDPCNESIRYLVPTGEKRRMDPIGDWYSGAPDSLRLLTQSTTDWPGWAATRTPRYIGPRKQEIEVMPKVRNTLRSHPISCGWCGVVVLIMVLLYLGGM